MRRAIAVALLLAGVLAGCGTLEIIPSKTERIVQRFEFTHTGARVTDVSCPSGVPAKAGNTFDCHFVAPDGTKYTAHVLIKRVQGTNVLFQINTFPTG